MTTSLKTTVVVPRPSSQPAADAGPPEKTQAQTIVHRTFLWGVILTTVQAVLVGAALWVVLGLLQSGTLVTPSAILLPAGCLVWYGIALVAMGRLRKHQRFNSWLPSLCYLAGLGAGVAMVLLQFTGVLGTNGLQGFFTQAGAVLPAGLTMGVPTQILAAASLVLAAGALCLPALWFILRLYLNSESRRLLKWMATK